MEIISTILRCKNSSIFLGVKNPVRGTDPPE
jgi:hypothetical protein